MPLAYHIMSNLSSKCKWFGTGRTFIIPYNIYHLFLCRRVIIVAEEWVVLLVLSVCFLCICYHNRQKEGDIHHSSLHFVVFTEVFIKKWGSLSYSSVFSAIFKVRYAPNDFVFTEQYVFWDKKSRKSVVFTE